MLKDSFYTLNDLNADDHSISAVLKLNPAHEIFKGHFPQQPVVPGVCLMQIIKEVLHETLKRDIQLKKAANLKFISPVDPGQNPVLNLTLNYQKTEENLIKVNGTIQAGDTGCFKFQEVFAVV